MRTITIFSTKGNSRTSITTDVSTWGQLQNKLIENNIDFDSLKAIVAATQNTLESIDATLPTTDFTLMLIPSKVKSGSDYTNQPYNDLRHLARTRGITGLNVPPTKPELVEALTQHDQFNSNTTVSFEPEYPIVEHEVLPTNSELILSRLYNLQTSIREIINLLENSNDETVEFDIETELLRRQAEEIIANLQ